VSSSGLGESGGTAFAQSPKPFGGQKTCPVSGEALGASGPPIAAATIRGLTIYTCSEECAARVRQDPETYRAKVLFERATVQ
jgi:hypothetical protein